MPQFLAKLDTLPEQTTETSTDLHHTNLPTKRRKQRNNSPLPSTSFSEVVLVNHVTDLYPDTFNGHRAVSQGVSMAVFQICKILLTCSMRLAVAKRSRPQDPVTKRHLEVFPSMKYLSLLFEKCTHVRKYIQKL